jgi:hypothetical protein
MPPSNAATGTYNNPGGFSKGYDPRRVMPTKRKLNKAIEEMCREHSELAVSFIAGLIADTEADDAVRLKAAETMLDRAYGKAVDRVAIKQVGGDSSADARLLTTDQIIALLTPAALESTPQESCQEIISSLSVTPESSYIVVGDGVADGSEEPQHGDHVAAQCDAPGAWPWSDTEEEAAGRHQDDDRRSEGTPPGDLK